ncbi:hypothetical protein BDY19DRAFT_992920 [Irpex rosettiformis]|uniref:Uncharacterized protein n=1 Tax=Irpex rosettiformis TaxID=378272 RepID=A0ACB8U6Q4_9APHY|nr:hypothetical protein BDY19DRAFT_992920 [Irpex rosettiformis]
MSSTTTTPTTPSSSTATNSSGHVHFDDSCVLIPDPVAQSRIPRLVKVSYSLPLWKKRSSLQQPSSDSEQDSAIATSPSKDGTVKITVPIPSFARSRSPTRSDHIHQPLVSCMVHGDHQKRYARRTSLSLPISPNAVVVPLRPCCAECYPITEECLREGDDWQEKFTRGARRRRNSSADACQYHHLQRHRTVREDLPGFGAVVSVDEVDKRHGISRTAATTHRDDDDEESLVPSSLSRLRDPAIMSLASPAAIGEEDENIELPLPLSLGASNHQTQEASPELSDALADAYKLSQHLDNYHTEHEDEDIPNRATLYYTPNTSPVIEHNEPAFLVQSPPSPTFADKDSFVVIESPGSKTPSPSPPPLPSHTAPIPIPDHTVPDHHKAWYSDFTLATLDLLHESDHPHNPARSSIYSTSTASPELSDYVPTLASTSPSKGKKNFLHSLPRPGAFLRVGSDVLKGMAAPGTVSGTFL